jgi:predicted transglutaminase-like cysteine proteinase
METSGIAAVGRRCHDPAAGYSSMSKFMRTGLVTACCAIAIGLALAWLAVPQFGHLLLGPTPNDRVRTTHSEFAPIFTPEPFGFDAERAPAGELWTKWRRVEAALRAEMATIAQCRATPDACRSAAARQFIAIADEARMRSGRARIGAVNRAFNLAVQYVDDRDQHGVDDHWSAPLATLAAGRGDCEDYAIAKLIALREAGVADDDLRFIIVRDVKLKEYHAALAVRLDRRWIVLDNRRHAMVEDHDLAHYVPLFAIRQDIGVLQYAQAASPRRSSGRYVVSQR